MSLRGEQSESRHKIVWNDFEQDLLDPKGEGQDARSNLMMDSTFL